MSILGREVWGPSLWYVMHTLANKSGNQTSYILQLDEINIWINIIKTLHNIMPCALCASHYKEWILKTNLRKLHEYKGLQLQEWLQNFWYVFHNNVNTKTNKPEFIKDGLLGYTAATEFNNAWDLLKRMTAYGIQHNQLNLMAVKTTMKHLEVLKRLYGL